jgi:tyrosyl-tRNA synthetase
MTEEFFHKGIIEIIDDKNFRSKLKSKKLRIKYGVDPTRPDIHLGHTVQLWKLKKLQKAGHKIIFLIGDYTTKIGDPSGRNSTRPVLTDEEIKENSETYFAQVGKILDIEKTEIRYNSEWYSKMDFNDILQLAGKFTVAQILERDDFNKRMVAHNDIGLHELLYPVMQAYDSVVLKADVEFGGSDQRFNMLAGRDLQKKMGLTPQDVFITDLLVGLDGKVKMSKSVGNYIGITEDANTMYGKAMSIPDELIVNYFELVTDKTEEEIAEIKTRLKNGVNPRNSKMELAYEIAKIFHGSKKADEAQNEFVSVYSDKQLPADIPKISLNYGNYGVPLLLINLGITSSNSEARRLISQGAVKIDEAKITDWKAIIGVKKGMLIQVGKLKYFKIK